MVKANRTINFKQMDQFIHCHTLRLTMGKYLSKRKSDVKTKYIFKYDIFKWSRGRLYVTIPIIQIYDSKLRVYTVLANYLSDKNDESSGIYRLTLVDRFQTRLFKKFIAPFEIDDEIISLKISQQLSGEIGKIILDDIMINDLNERVSKLSLPDSDDEEMTKLYV